jgi:hypothetical protein
MKRTQALDKVNSEVCLSPNGMIDSTKERESGSG